MLQSSKPLTSKTYCSFNFSFKFWKGRPKFCKQVGKNYSKRTSSFTSWRSSFGPVSRYPSAISSLTASFTIAAATRAVISRILKWWQRTHQLVRFKIDVSMRKIKDEISKQNILQVIPDWCWSDHELLTMICQRTATFKLFWGVHHNVWSCLPVLAIYTIEQFVKEQKHSRFGSMYLGTGGKMMPARKSSSVIIAASLPVSKLHVRND